VAPVEFRVLHLLDSLSVGGTERNAVRVLSELHRRGHAVHLVVFRGGPLEADLVKCGIPVHRIRVRSFYSAAFLREARKLAHFIEEKQVRLLHAHDRYSNIFAAAAGMLGLSIPTIASKRWDSGGDPWSMRAASRFALRAATRVLVNSDAVAKTALRDEGVRASRIRVIPNFVDDVLFETPTPSLRHELRRELGLRPDQPVIVCVANLRPVKNHRLLLEAVAAVRTTFPEIRLVLVGDGPSADALARQAGELHLQQEVLFLGQRSEAWRFHAAGDLSVLASVSEGFPNALVEAQALGVPVVATAVGGVVEAVLDQRTGLLVPEGDAAAMTGAILSLLQDPGRGRAMGLAAREATRKFSREAVMARMLALYQELLA
jgi:glycosyltransferase involved in cell wall biosynthesis